MLVQRRRDSRAALKLMRKLLKKQGFTPKLLVTERQALLTERLRSASKS
jgi:transposase-like protein